LFENGRKETTKTQLLFESESWNLIKNDPGKKRTFFLSTLSLSLTHTHTHTLSDKHTLTLSLSLSLILTHTLTHTFLSHTHTHAFWQTHTLYPSNSLSLILTHTHTHTPTHPHTHTHTHTHTHKHTHTFLLSLSFSLSLWVRVIRAGVASELVVVRRIYSLLASFFAGEQKRLRELTEILNKNGEAYRSLIRTVKKWWGGGERSVLITGKN